VRRSEQVMRQDTVDSEAISLREPRPGPEDPARTAFVLTGGASRAAVQVGMLEALTEAGIRPDFLIGISAGAVNAVAYAADPTGLGIVRLKQGWRRARRSQVFPLWSPSPVLKAIGRRDHLLTNRGLAALIGAFVGVEQLEAGVIPVHVVATDLQTGSPVLLSQGQVLPALLASTAIPGVFPPVEIDGRLLVDGGVASDTPTVEAELLGASTIFVLPTFGVGTDARPSRHGMRVRLSAIGQLLGQSGTTTIATTRGSAVHLVPAPPTATISPYDFSQSARLIEQASALTREWLADCDGMATSTQLHAGRESG
jgi:NTE family protein